MQFKSVRSSLWAVFLPVGAIVAAWALPASIVIALAGWLPAAAAEGETSSDVRDLSGVWWAESYNPKILPGVTFIVLTPEGESAYEKNKLGLEDGGVVDAARATCAPDGVPRIMAAPYPFEISQAPDQVTLRFEVNNAVRTVIMDQPLPPAEEVTPAVLGHSYGRWERDTLIVETVGFTDSTFLDATGLPHSGQLYVKEFFWKGGIAGRQLHYVAVVLDPETFSQVWVQRYVYERRPDIQIAAYECGGDNRDISQIAGAEAWN